MTRVMTGCGHDDIGNSGEGLRRQSVLTERDVAVTAAASQYGLTW